VHECTETELLYNEACFLGKKEEIRVVMRISAESSRVNPCSPSPGLACKQSRREDALAGGAQVLPQPMRPCESEIVRIWDRLTRTSRMTDIEVPQFAAGLPMMMHSDTPSMASSLL
jgi:hypothetical protein